MTIKLDKVSVKSFLESLRQNHDRSASITRHFTCKIALAHRERELAELRRKGWRAEGMQQSVECLRKTPEIRHSTISTGDRGVPK